MISYRAVRALAASAALAGLSACGANGDSALPQPFQGATVRIVVGFAPGGTYDLQARLLAGHLGGHLPGHPRVGVENMPGSGGALAANYIAHAAPGDGFTIGLLVEVSAPALATGNLLNDVHILGSPAATVPVIVFSKRSGIATLEDGGAWTVPP